MLSSSAFTVKNKAHTLEWVNIHQKSLLAFVLWVVKKETWNRKPGRKEIKTGTNEYIRQAHRQGAPGFRRTGHQENLNAITITKGRNLGISIAGICIASMRLRTLCLPCVQSAPLPLFPFGSRWPAELTLGKQELSQGTRDCRDYASTSTGLICLYGINPFILSKLKKKKKKVCFQRRVRKSGKSSYSTGEVFVSCNSSGGWSSVHWIKCLMSDKSCARNLERD